MSKRETVSSIVQTIIVLIMIVVLGLPLALLFWHTIINWWASLLP